MMNRRAFLQRFGIGVGAALALTAIPKAAIAALDTTEAGKRLACEFLRQRYNAHMRGKSVRDTPLLMRVPCGLFDAFAAELTSFERFVSVEELRCASSRHLMFKGTPLFEDPTMPGWDVRFTERPAPGVEYAMNTTGAVYV